jgi:hypothetical protein
MSVIKRIVIALIIFFPGIGVDTGWPLEREKLPIITDIGLIKEMPDRAVEPPGELSIGITITNDAFYKLLHQSEMIKGGILKKGFNRVGIAGGDLFGAPGTYVYILETKADQYGFRYEITVDIQLATPAAESSAASSASPGSPGSLDAKKSSESGEGDDDLSMCAGGHFTARVGEGVYGRVIESRMEGIREVVESGPGYPLDPVNPAALSISIIPLIKAILKKKKTSVLLQPREVSVVFLREDRAGVSREVHAVISLQSRVIENVSR